MSELYTAQRVDNGEWVTGNYIHQYHSFKKGRRINAIVVSTDIKSSRYEILDETLKQIDGKKIKSLERQLAEAREEVKKAVKQGFDAMCDGGFCPITFDEFWARSEFNKLKEN